jgi:hypothetical protein
MKIKLGAFKINYLISSYDVSTDLIFQDIKISENFPFLSNM